MPTGGANKKSLNQVLADFRAAHGDRYDYSKVEYRSNKEKVVVICTKHGEFEIRPEDHQNGHGCKQCYLESLRMPKSEFVRRAKKCFGDHYDYSLFHELPAKGKKLQIRCQEHDLVFHQAPRNHLACYVGCPKCVSNSLSGVSTKRHRFNDSEKMTLDFIEKAKSIHKDVYDYSKTKYQNATSKVTIICPLHGEFKQAPTNHLRGRGCRFCGIERLRLGTFKQKCKDLGVNYNRALKRRQTGLPEEKVFETGYIRTIAEVNKITVNGVEYPNLKEAIRNVNPSLKRKTVARRLEVGISPEEALTREPSPGYRNGIIYLIKNKKNEMMYVGLTVSLLSVRWGYHIKEANSDHVKQVGSLHAAIRKYGEDAFEIHQIDTGIAKNDLERKERYWINLFGTYTPNGYNLTLGGESGGRWGKPTVVDGKRFVSVIAAAEYVANTRGISVGTAESRIRNNRIDVKHRTPRDTLPNRD